MKLNRHFIFRNLDKPAPQSAEKAPKQKNSITERRAEARQYHEVYMRKMLEKGYAEALQRYDKSSKNLAKAKKESQREAKKNPRIAALLNEAETVLQTTRTEIEKYRNIQPLADDIEDSFQNFDDTLDSKEDVLALKKSPEDARLYDAMPITVKTSIKLDIIDFLQSPVALVLNITPEEKVKMAIELSQNPDKLSKNLQSTATSHITKTLKLDENTAKIASEMIFNMHNNDYDKIAATIKTLPTLLPTIYKLQTAGFQRDIATKTTLESIKARGFEETVKGFDAFLALSIPSTMIEDVFLSTDPLTESGLIKAKEIANATSPDNPEKPLFDAILKQTKFPSRAIEALSIFKKPEIENLNLTAKEKIEIVEKSGDMDEIKNIIQAIRQLNLMGNTTTEEIKSQIKTPFTFDEFLTKKTHQYIQQTLKVKRSRLRMILGYGRGLAPEQIKGMPKVVDIIDKLEQAGAERDFAARAMLLALYDSTPEEIAERFDKVIALNLPHANMSRIIRQTFATDKDSFNKLFEQAIAFKDRPTLIGVKISQAPEEIQNTINTLEKAFPKITDDEIAQILSSPSILKVENFIDFANKINSEEKKQYPINILIAAFESHDVNKPKVIKFFEDLQKSNINPDTARRLYDVSENSTMAIALHPYLKEVLSYSDLRAINDIDPIKNPKLTLLFVELRKDSKYKETEPSDLKEIITSTQNTKEIETIAYIMSKGKLPAKTAIILSKLATQQNLSSESMEKIFKHSALFEGILSINEPFLDNRIVTEVEDLATKFPEFENAFKYCFVNNLHYLPNFEDLGKIFIASKKYNINVVIKLYQIGQSFVDEYNALVYFANISDPILQTLTAHVIKTSVAETEENLKLFAQDPAMPLCIAVYPYIKDNPELVLQIGRNLFLEMTPPGMVTQELVDKAIAEQKETQKEMENEHQWKNTNVVAFAHNELWMPTDNARDSHGQPQKSTRFMRDETVVNIHKSVENGTYEEFRPPQNPTPEQLRQLKKEGIEKAIAAKPPMRLIFNGHGGPEHLYLTQGLAEDVVKGLKEGSKEAQDINTLSVKDLSHILIERNRLYGSKVNQDQVIFMSCFNHTFLRNVAKEVTESGSNHPTYIGSSEYGQFGFSQSDINDTLLNKVLGIGNKNEKTAALLARQDAYKSSNITVYRPNKKGILQQVAEGEKPPQDSMNA